MSQQSYSTENIQLLSDIEHIRARPGMYIGELMYPTQLLYEITDNALDESQSGNNDLTDVHISSREDGLPIYRVVDHGRGIPIGKVEYEGTELEALQALFMKSNSGAKFNSEVYKIRGGLHGVGGVCACALSLDFEVTTRRDGQSVTLITHQGELVSLEYNETDEPNGVEVAFTPDPEIFEVVYIPQDLIINRCRIVKAMGYPISLTVDDELIDIDIDNVLGLLPDEKLSSYCEDIIEVSDDNGESLIVGFRYTNATNRRDAGYTNLIPNQYGGTHIGIVNDSIINCWTNYKSSVEHNFLPQDSLLGIRTVVACFIENAAFSNQVKDKLTVPRKRFDSLSEKFEKAFSKWLNKNRELADRLVERFNEHRRNISNMEAQKEIMNKVVVAKVDTKSNSTRRGSAVVPKLIDCLSRSREDTELFLVEGDSTAGTLARPRNPMTQAVLPLRGKIQNVSGMSIKDALSHPTILDIINAIGCGCGDMTDPSKSRYERIIITTDADADGAHIVALILTGLVNLVPELVKQGYVYVIQAPLYGWWDKQGNKSYSINFEDVNQDDFKAGRFERYKGLGSLGDEDFKESCLNLENRVMYRIEYPTDIEKFNWIAGTSEGRMDLLSQYGVIVKNERGS